MTPFDIESEYWAHNYADSPPGEEFEDDDFDMDAILESMGDDEWEDVINDRA